MGPPLMDKPDDRAVTFATTGDGCWFGNCTADPFVLPAVLAMIVLAVALFLRMTAPRSR